MMTATLGSYSALASRATSTSEPRTLVFPMRARVGQLYVRPVTGPGKRPWQSATEGWRYWGEAQDRVEVPVETELMLQVRQRDLSFLTAMGPDAFTMLDCSSLGLTDSDTGPLRHTTGFHAINLSGNPGISDFTLAYLTKHYDMEWLCVDKTGISGTMVSAGALGYFKNLAYFSAVQTPFEDPGVAHLVNCERLRVLLLGGTRVTDNSARHLAMVRTLETLSLEDDHIGSGTLDSLRSIPGLRYLNLGGTPIGDRDIRHLGRLPEVRFVNLDRTRITNASVPMFMSIPTLQQVSARDTNITIRSLPGQFWRVPPRIVLASPGKNLLFENWASGQG